MRYFEDSNLLLKRGDRGDYVMELQEDLIDLGYSPEPLNGIFGPKTEKALKALQRDFSVEVDGVLRPELAKRIREMREELEKMRAEEPKGPPIPGIIGELLEFFGFFDGEDFFDDEDDYENMEKIQGGRIRIINKDREQQDMTPGERATPCGKDLLSQKASSYSKRSSGRNKRKRPRG